MDVITGLPQSSKKIVPSLFLNCHHEFHSLEQQIPSINFLDKIYSYPHQNQLIRWCIKVVLFRYVSTQDDIFHTMKIVDILGKHHAKHEAVLDLRKTASLLLQPSSLPSLFLNRGKFLWKMSTITIQLTKTITYYENIADIKEIWSKNVNHLIHLDHAM